MECDIECAAVAPSALCDCQNELGPTPAVDSIPGVAISTWPLGGVGLLPVDLVREGEHWFGDDASPTARAVLRTRTA